MNGANKDRYASQAMEHSVPHGRGVWIRTYVRAPMDVVWARTADPDDHARWDLRFTRIIADSRNVTETSGAIRRHSAHSSQSNQGARRHGGHLQDRTRATQPRCFRYQTRFPVLSRWVGVEGWGAYQARLSETTASSSLQFGSEQKRSFIESGSGYWRYAADGDGTWFETWYDYRVRGGLPGRLVDRWLFRPAMAWATAWSFDRLARWVEDGTAPDLSLRLGLIHGLGRLITAFVFLYHGLVPKFFWPDQTEWNLVAQSGMPAETVIGLGLLEVGLALWLLLRWSDRRPLIVAAGTMLVLTLGLAATHPEVFLWAFNPLTLNLSVAVLATAAWLASEHAPRASRTEWGWGPPGRSTPPS